MSQFVRKSVFYLFVGIFLISGGAVTFYSLGWRINLKPPAGESMITKVGAISIKSAPQGITIKINQRIFLDKSGLVQTSTLIPNLLPKIYSVRIEKNGYFSYDKTIKVEPSMVSKLLKIRLIPENLKPEIIASVKGTSFVDFGDDKFILQKKEDNIYYLNDLKDFKSVFNVTAAYQNKLTAQSEIKRANFVPFNSKQLIIDNGYDIKIMDIQSLTIETIIKKPNIWTVKNSNIYFLKNLTLYSYNLIFKNLSALTALPKTISNHNFISIKSSPLNDKIAFLDSNGGLYLFNQNSNDIKEIAHSAKFFAFSPDNKKIVFLDNDGKIGIDFLEESNADLIKKAGDVSRFDLENKEAIKSLDWYADSYHLFVNFANEVKFMEIDDRSALNVYPIINASQFYYEPKTNIFYFIIDSKLQKIDFNNQ
ncbi:MAG: PEGA domain-containing protein [Patescibacteria group bacterium]